MTIAVLEKELPTGWGLNMTLVRLPDGGLLVHSPTWLGDATFDRVEAIGRPRVLFAPNHFHHLSLRRFADRWPDAPLVAGAGALPRLKKLGHASAMPVAPLPGVSFLECEGTRTGETFLSLDVDGERTWIACDAFFHVNRATRGAMGLALRATGTVPGLRIGQTFLWLGLSDRPAYKRWILEALSRERPTRLLVSHGEPIAAPDLPERLAALVRARV